MSHFKDHKELESSLDHFFEFAEKFWKEKAFDQTNFVLPKHDVLYHESHFDVEPESGICFYNSNVWKVDSKTGKALHYLCDQTSELCADRKLLVEHYKIRVAQVAKIAC